MPPIEPMREGSFSAALAMMSMEFRPEPPPVMTMPAGRSPFLPILLQMRLDELEYVREPRGHDLLELLPRERAAGDGADLDLLGFFQRHLQSEGDVVGDVGRADGEDFERGRDAVLEDGDRDRLGADVGQNATGDFLRFRQSHETGGDRRGHDIFDFDAGFIDGLDEVGHVMVETGDEERLLLELVAGHAGRIPQRRTCRRSCIAAGCCKMMRRLAIEAGGMSFSHCSCNLARSSSVIFRVSPRSHDRARDRHAREADAADAHECFLDLDAGFFLGDGDCLADALGYVAHIGHISVAQAARFGHAGADDFGQAFSFFSRASTITTLHVGADVDSCYYVSCHGIVR